ncbi:hypothetical protein NVS55_03970 [Myxococcus stipitatus]|uniref:hypothetical protein n=1 Tax=Myxococcus stipitatus TaxID=83455 RepID=UPI003144DD18
MLKPLQLALLVSLMADASTLPPKAKPVAVSPDAGPTPDAGPRPSPPSAESIPWPKDLKPLATLDGTAVLAAHAVLQQVLAGFPKGAANACEFSARSLDVVVGQEAGMYFVRVDRRPERCGWNPGASLEFDWFELYAVSADGRVLARYPHRP